MDVFIWCLVGAYLALGGYILYQAIMLDKYRRWNDELMREVEYLRPPF